MLLLFTLLATVPPTIALALNTTTESCAPASCGGLNISYPFWLAGTHPPECGYKDFQVTCDKGDVILLLEKTFWRYKILDIFYENSSFRVANVDLSDGTCNNELQANATTDLGLAPFKISDINQELFFLYDCRRQARQHHRSWAPVNCTGNATNSFAWLAEKNRFDAVSTLLLGNCTVSSMMPVLGYHGATGADYQRLVKGGFLLEYTAVDCDACTATGGQCRVNNTIDFFECHCTDGVSPLDCNEFIYG